MSLDTNKLVTKKQLNEERETLKNTVNLIMTKLLPIVKNILPIVKNIEEKEELIKLKLDEAPKSLEMTELDAKFSNNADIFKENQEKLNSELEKKINANLEEKLNINLGERLNNDIKEILNENLNQKFDQKFTPFEQSITTKTDDQITKFQVLNEKMDSFLEQFNQISLKLDRFEKKQEIYNTELTLKVAEISKNLISIKTNSKHLPKDEELLECLDKKLDRIENQQEEIKKMEELIYHPPEPISTGEFAIHPLKLPDNLPVFKTEGKKEAILESLDKFKAQILKDNIIGSDLIQAITSTGDKILQNLIQRGSLIRFFTQLKESLGHMYADVLPTEYKKKLAMEVEKAIKFYNSAQIELEIKK